MAWIAVEVRGRSFIGSSVCRHLHPLNTWAIMPKGNDKSIQVQFISWSITCSTCLKSKPRYIQYNIAPPRKSERAILNVSFMICLIFNFLIFIPCKNNANRWKRKTKWGVFSSILKDKRVFVALFYRVDSGWWNNKMKHSAFPETEKALLVYGAAKT